MSETNGEDPYGNAPQAQPHGSAPPPPGPPTNPYGAPQYNATGVPGYGAPGPGMPPYGMPPYGMAPYPQPPRTGQGLAWTAFGLSVVACVPLLPLVGLVLGVVALARRCSPRWPAVVAVVVGAVLTVLQTVAAPSAVDSFRRGWNETRAPHHFSSGTPRSNLVRTLRLRVGECFDDPSILGVGKGDVNVEWVKDVPCANPHQWEVFAQFHIAGKRFPGVGVIRQTYGPRCFPAFTRYDGVPLARSKLEIYEYHALEGSWRLFGDRNFTCFAGLRSGKRVSGSMRHRHR